MNEKDHQITRTTDQEERTGVAHFLGSVPLHFEEYKAAHFNDVVKALEQANVGLMMAERFYEEGLVREAFRCSLMTSKVFFQAIGAPAGQVAPFMRLAVAIEDLDRGAIDPALKTPKRVGPPLDSTAAWNKRAQLVAALEMEIASGKTVLAGIKSIEKHIRSLRRGTLSRASDTESLSSWRKKFQARTVVAGAQMIYDTFLEVVATQVADKVGEERATIIAAYRDHAIKMAGSTLPDAGP